MPASGNVSERGLEAAYSNCKKLPPRCGYPDDRMSRLVHLMVTLRERCAARHSTYKEDVQEEDSQRVPTGPVSLRRRATAPRGMGECREASPDSCGEAGTGRVDRRHPRVRNLPVRPAVPVGLRERFTCWAHIGAVGGRKSTFSLGLPAGRRLDKTHRDTIHSRHDICEVAD